MPLRIRFLVLMLASMFLLCAGFLGVLPWLSEPCRHAKTNKIILTQRLYTAAGVELDFRLECDCFG